MCLDRTGCFSAANSSMTMKRSPEGTTFLIKLLDVLEEVSSLLFASFLPFFPSHSSIQIETAFH